MRWFDISPGSLETHVILDMVGAIIMAKRIGERDQRYMKVQTKFARLRSTMELDNFQEFVSYIHFI